MLKSTTAPPYDIATAATVQNPKLFLVLPSTCTSHPPRFFGTPLAPISAHVQFPIQFSWHMPVLWVQTIMRTGLTALFCVSRRLFTPPPTPPSSSRRPPPPLLVSLLSPLFFFFFALSCLRPAKTETNTSMRKRSKSRQLATALTVPRDSKGDVIQLHTAAYNGDSDALSAYISQGGDFEVSKNVQQKLMGKHNMI